MTRSKTTLCGALGGAATALQALPDLPGWLRAALIISAAAAFILLGYHATDCPPNCPGTDKYGRRLGNPAADMIAGPLILLLFIGLLSALVLCAGCTAMWARSYTQAGAGTNRVEKGGAICGVTLFDSGQVLGRTRVTYLGGTNDTAQAGISTAGFSQQSSSTGLVTIIQTFGTAVPPVAGKP
ncbi:MAG TPA: hypothetical protein VMU04_02930 [Candidatus Acidoferrum sp.]|nr:hypothetical protein [Candidatus Acidoferrum sp.]